MQKRWLLVALAVVAALVLWLVLKPGTVPAIDPDAVGDRTAPEMPVPPSLPGSPRGAGPRSPEAPVEPGPMDDPEVVPGGVEGEDEAAIFGVVVDDDTGKPVAGAIVGVEDEGQQCPRLPFALEGYLLGHGDVGSGKPHVRVSTARDAAGNERLIAVDTTALTGEEGTFRLRWFKDRKADLFAHRRGSVLACLCAVEPGKTLEVRLKGGLTIQGVVTRADGRRIGGATLRTSEAPGALPRLGHVEAAVADEEGDFTITGLLPGAVLVTADHPQFMPVTLATPVEPGGPPVRIAMVPAFLATLRVATDDGQKPQNATVAWRTDSVPPKSGLQLLTEAPPSGTQTDIRTEPAYEPVKVPCDAATATLEVKADGYAPWRAEREQLPSDGGEKSYDVLLFRDSNLGSLKVTFEDREGKPLSFVGEQADARPWRRDGKPISAGIVIQPGEALVLPSLPAGPYGLLVRSPLHAPAILTVDVAPGGPTERRLVLGPPGKLRVKFTATETFLVKFRLLDGNEVAYPYPEGARPAPRPEQGGDGGNGSPQDDEPTLWAGADGILLTGLRSTTYTVEVISPDLVAKPVSVAVVEGETREVEVHVAKR